jgi:TetR/AcrR family transcriptional repressor of nem operon
LTKAAGCMHGGFYNHFESKADLAIETARYAFEQSPNDISGERAGGLR